MKRIIKIASLAALCLMLALLAVSCGSSAPASDSGDCGSGLTWSYDAETQTLSISGNGQMKDYENSTDAPWSGAKTHIKSLDIDLGVEKIGDKAFYGFTALETVSIPDSVIDIGDYSFAYCSAVTTVSLPDSLTTIGEGAFEGCSALTVAFVPSEVTSLGKNAFAFCPAITDAAILANTEIPEGIFFNCGKLDRLLLNAAITEDMVADTAFKGCEMSFEDAKFTESKTAAASITVKYVDGDGNEMSEAKVEEDIAYGDSYSIVSPAIDGYTADKLTVSGYLYGTDETVTVTYTADEVVETEPVEEEEEEEKEVTPTTIIAIVVLGVVLVGIAVGAILLMRADKKNAAKGQTVRKNDNKNNKKK
ncbi:MAG: leucine-rich repeat protein [Clostridia bacterium]|nr:leucine-rich repeat protein [Clostridia bacterium]